MDLVKIEQAVADLDQSILKQNARMRLYQYGGYDDESCVDGTPEGYMRFGIELMKAGLTNTAETKFVDVDLDYLFDANSTISFNVFEKVETMEQLDNETSEETWRDRIFIFIVICVLIAFPILAIIGLVTVIRALL